jgi:hypothetical protein
MIPLLAINIEDTEVFIVSYCEMSLHVGEPRVKVSEVSKLLVHD